jgi:hypothetical protein
MKRGKRKKHAGWELRFDWCAAMTKGVLQDLDGMWMYFISTPFPFLFSFCSKMTSKPFRTPPPAWLQNHIQLYIKAISGVERKYSCQSRQNRLQGHSKIISKVSIETHLRNHFEIISRSYPKSSLNHHKLVPESSRNRLPKWCQNSHRGHLKIIYNFAAKYSIRIPPAISPKSQVPLLNPFSCVVGHWIYMLLHWLRFCFPQKLELPLRQCGI